MGDNPRRTAETILGYLISLDTLASVDGTKVIYFVLLADLKEAE